MLQSDAYQRHQVKICRVVAKGSQTWPSPGVEKLFLVPEPTMALALKLVDVARAQVRLRGWRVFDGDVDLTTTSGLHKGAVDALADKDDAVSALALVELKVRRLVGQDGLENEAMSLCSSLDQKWAAHVVPRLKAAWARGVVVMLCQSSPCKLFLGRNVCRVVVWSRGSPLTLAAPNARAQAKAAPQPKAKDALT